MLPEKTLLLMRGIPASGKTTWVKENINPDSVVRPDDIRYMLYGRNLWKNGYLYVPPHIEDATWIIVMNAIYWRMCSNQKLIVVDSSLCYEQEYLNEILSDYKTHCNIFSYKLMYKQLDVPLEECLERSKHRSNREPSPNDIRLMHNRMTLAIMPDFITKLE